MEHIIMNIKREQRGFSVTELSVLSKVDKSLISRYLSGKISLSKDKVNAIYQSIGEYHACTQTSKNDLINYVKELYSDLIDLKEPKIKFQEYIELDWKHARDRSYFVWLIGMLMYMHFLKEKPILVQKKELINTLIKYEMYIPFEFYSMFYCTIAIYFAENKNWEKSEYYLNRAKSSATNEIDLGFSLYHLGKFYSNCCYLSEALDCFNNANIYFTKSFYMNASLNVQIDTAIVYQKLGLYKKADKHLESCIHYIYQQKNNAIDIKTVYLCKVFNCVVSKSYERIIDEKDILLNIFQNKTLVNLWLAISYYHLDILDNAKIHILDAWREENYCSIYDKPMIDLYKKMINGNSFEKCEKKFLEILKMFEEKRDVHLQIYVLEEMVHYSSKEDNYQRTLKYYKMLNDIYKKRH